MQVLSRIVFCLTFVGITSGAAQALTFEISGETAIVSGSMDYPDMRRIDDAVAKGAKIFVMRNIGGGDIEVNASVARHLQKKQITTVIDGVCGGGCADLLLAGKERRFAYPAAGRSAVVLVRGAVFTGDARGPANISDVYVKYRERLTDVISNALLDKHTTGNFENNGLLFFAPTAGDGTAGYVLDCDNLSDMRKTCKKVEGADPVNAGFFTSAEPITLPPAPAKP